MNHDIYVFGSLIRGDVHETSDVDVLVIPRDSQAPGSYPESWSVYSMQTLESYYRRGRLFAWHLHLESRCVYSACGTSFLEGLGPPAPYSSHREDVDDLRAIMSDSIAQIRGGTNSLIYELGLVHTAIRDIAMSASWRLLGSPNFSRDVPYLLPLACPLPVDAYRSAMLARHSSTRGAKVEIDAASAAEAIAAAPLLRWSDEIRTMIR